jgi:hypothetical protein
LLMSPLSARRRATPATFSPEHLLAIAHEVDYLPVAWCGGSGADFIFKAKIYRFHIFIYIWS